MLMLGILPHYSHHETNQKKAKFGKIESLGMLALVPCVIMNLVSNPHSGMRMRFQLKWIILYVNMYFMLF